MNLGIPEPQSPPTKTSHKSTLLTDTAWSEGRSIASSSFHTTSCYKEPFYNLFSSEAALPASVFSFYLMFGGKNKIPQWMNR